jgi:hypothetical protein
MTLAYVRNHSKASVVLRASAVDPATGAATEHAFDSGGNAIDSEKLSTLRANPNAERFFSAKLLTVYVPGATEPKSDLLGEIAACENRQQLRDWINTKGHDLAIREALVQRYLEINRSAGAPADVDADSEGSYV